MDSFSWKVRVSTFFLHSFHYIIPFLLLSFFLFSIPSWLFSFLVKIESRNLFCLLSISSFLLPLFFSFSFFLSSLPLSLSSEMISSSNSRQSLKKRKKMDEISFREKEEMRFDEKKERFWERRKRNKKDSERDLEWIHFLWWLIFRRKKKKRERKKSERKDSNGGFEFQDLMRVRMRFGLEGRLME